MKFLIVILVLLSSVQSFSDVNKCCYCEIGDRPALQRGFFRMGCNVWLGRQVGCTVKDTVDQNSDYANMNLECDGGVLNLGYVGHWANAYQTSEYLVRVVAPAIQKHNVSVNVDNTACSSMDRPEIVLSTVKKMNLPPGKTVTVKGNQAVSVGEWQSVFGSNLNFEATVSSEQNEVTYPSCADYQGKTCFDSLQGGQTGVCINDKNQKQVLTCCNGTMISAPPDDGIWGSREQCGSHLSQTSGVAQKDQGLIFDDIGYREYRHTGIRDIRY